MICRTSLGTALMVLLLACSTAFGYSVLTHQAIIDASWDDVLPLLKRRFPRATSEELRDAHSYAYGGSIIQDSGYFPFGSKFCTNLLHYVRSGDFIEAMIADSQDLNEYAFALGALAHYAADNSGHPLAVNPSVPLVYPKLARKYGPVVTYAESPSAHFKMEFGFDVLQVARGQYTPQGYRDFIGFEVSKPLLERSFQKVYCLEMKDLFASVDLALGTYRHSVSTIIPEMTKVAWQVRKSDIEKVMPGIKRERFVYGLPRADYEKQWGNTYEKPGFLARFLALVFRFFPKIGIMRALAFKPPTPEAEKMFLTSFETTLARYRDSLAQTRSGSFDLRNMDFDTGQPTQAGEYELCDKTYGELLTKLADRKFVGVSGELRADLLRFYGDLNAPAGMKRDRKKWGKTLAALQQLRALRISTDQPGAGSCDKSPASRR